jgi:hypothetical protein
MTIGPSPSPAALRRAALAAAVCLLLAAPLRAADIEYYSLANLKTQGFQKFLDDARDQGYEPVYINGYEVGDHTEFAGVAIKNPDDKRQFEYRFDITDEEYRDYFKEMSEKGFRPGCVTGYHTKKGTRFAVVFVKDKNRREWRAKHNQTQQEFEDTLAAMRRDGFVLTHATAFQAVDGGVRYTSLFYEPARGQKWENRHNMTGDQLTEQMDKWRSRDFRAAKIHAYDTPDGLRFLAIAVKPERDTLLWQERHDMSGREYQKQYDKLGNDGYRPGCICGYRDSGEVRFAVIWVKNK